MSQVPCMYAIVRYAPFVETGEFANVGIVLMAPAAGYLDFKLMDKRYGRITRFFGQIDPALFRDLIATLSEELANKKHFLRQHGFDGRPQDHAATFAKRIFMEIARPREAIIRFSEVRGVLVADPETKLKELYGHYVERSFVSRKGVEARLERGIRNLFVSERIIDRFSAMQVGNEEYHANFPFVEMKNGVPRCAIKPLFLGQDQSSKILDHGGQWVMRLHALKKRNLLPEKVLFAVDGPADGGIRGRAFDEIVVDLQNAGGDVLPVSNQQQILQFSTSD